MLFNEAWYKHRQIFLFSNLEEKDLRIFLNVDERIKFSVVKKIGSNVDRIFLLEI